MKAYITPLGFDSSQIISLIVKYGIEEGDRIVLIRPRDEMDSRAEATIDAVTNLSRQISSAIEVNIHRVDHRDFEGMVLSFVDLIKITPGQIVANISGGPREIFLAFAVACLSQSGRIYKTTNFSDIDRTLREITLPNITYECDEKSRAVLQDINDNQPTTVTHIAKRLDVSESTISRQVSRLEEIKSIRVLQKGKTKEITISLTGKMLL